MRTAVGVWMSDMKRPRKVWSPPEIWFGLCINTQAGEYKGWPITEEERHAVFG